MDRRGSAHIITKTLGLLLIALAAACRMVETEQPAQETIPETTCKSTSYTHLIGHNESVLDTLGLPERTRVLRPGMAMTMDYFEGRLNFYLDQTGKIIKLSCG